MFGNVTRFNPEVILTASDNMEFVIRIVVAAVMGILIGVERASRLKEAGIRTHCIVAMTSAVFMILSKYAFVDLEGVEGVRGADAARIAAQVVSGISFLGAGIIFKQGKNTVKGLTTAAGIWATAAVGMAAGAGLYWVAATECVLLLAFQTILHQHQIGTDAFTEQEIRIIMGTDDRSDFNKFIKDHNCIIEKSTLERRGDIVEMNLSLRAKIPLAYEEVLDFMHIHPSVSVFDVDTI